MSTILAVSVLSDVPAYMIVTFFKTVFLAISIGFLHGLVFLPLMLSVFVGKIFDIHISNISIKYCIYLGCCSSNKIETKSVKEPRFVGRY